MLERIFKDGLEVIILLWTLVNYQLFIFSISVKYKGFDYFLVFYQNWFFFFYDECCNGYSFEYRLNDVFSFLLSMRLSEREKG